MKGEYLMANKISSTPLLPQPKDKTPVPASTRVQKIVHSSKREPWPLFTSLLVLGVIILIVASTVAWNLLRNVKVTTNQAPTQAPMVTFEAQRTASYAGLEFTLVNAQYATTFIDDDIHSGSGVVRLNMKVANNSSDQINIVYYDIARLLAPKLSPIAPTNVSLSVGPKPHTSETGWLDFSVSSPLQLSTLQFQLGSTTLGESLVKIPLSGPFNASRYNDRTSPQNLDISYYFPYYNRQLIIYHLKSVDIRYAYRGNQAKAGQQYYVLNFKVDNPNGTNISPGFGYDYIRLSFNGGPIHPPIDNTLPYGFNALAKGVGGRVVFLGPAGLKAITIDFLVQYQSGGSYYNVTR
jgi:hypothetical protein